MRRQDNIQKLLDRGIRVFSFIGEAGGGKSELALHFAGVIAEGGERPVHLIDMDQTKPVFRLRNVVSREELEEENIRFHAGRDFLDIPVTLAGIKTMMEDETGVVVIDIGGNPSGAVQVGQYAALFERSDAIAFLVLNYYRPYSQRGEDLKNTIETYSALMRMPLTHIISNPNLGKQTTVQDIYFGNRELEKELSKWDYTVDFICLEEGRKDPLLDSWADRIIEISPKITYVLSERNGNETI